MLKWCYEFELAEEEEQSADVTSLLGTWHPRDTFRGMCEGG